MKPIPVPAEERISIPPITYHHDRFWVTVDMSDPDDEFDTSRLEVLIRLDADGTISVYVQDGPVGTLDQERFKLTTGIPFRQFHELMTELIRKRGRG